MEASIKINNVNCTFGLIYGKEPDTITLTCNNYGVLTVSPKGITRISHVPSGIFKTEPDGKIKMRTEHDGMRDQRSIGKADVALKLKPKSTEIYVTAINTINGDEVELFYIDVEGLYLWIADQHSRNCYAMAKSNTIKLVV